MKLDLSHKKLQRIDSINLSKYLNDDENNDIEIVLLDFNSLSKLENLEKLTQLKHVSKKTIKFKFKIYQSKK
jgi:hypothetical protein